MAKSQLTPSVLQGAFELSLEEKHFAPLIAAWRTYEASLGAIEAAVVDHPDHLQITGGMVPLAANGATWGDMARGALEVKRLREQLTASFRPKREAHEKAERELMERLQALPDSP